LRRHGDLLPKALFANAGIAKFNPIEETLEKDFDDVMRTNVTAGFLTVQAALALMSAGVSLGLSTQQLRIDVGGRVRAVSGCGGFSE